MSTELTRRSVLIGTLAAAAAVAGGGGWLIRERRRAGRLAAARALAAELGLAATDPGLGRAYLELHPSEADPERLSSLLFGDRGEADPETLKGVLAERIGLDWIELETVQLDGWIVSRTEGRLLALATLLSAQVGPERS